MPLKAFFFLKEEEIKQLKPFTGARRWPVYLLVLSKVESTGRLDKSPVAPLVAVVPVVLWYMLCCLCSVFQCLDPYCSGGVMV